jgi:hypothetical protein
MQAGQCSAQAGAGKLEQLQAAGLQLSTTSMQLLSLADPREQQSYAATSEGPSSANLSYITCMGVIRQTADEVSSVAQARHMYCMHNTTISGEWMRPVPVLLACHLPQHASSQAPC